MISVCVELCELEWKKGGVRLFIIHLELAMILFLWFFFCRSLLLHFHPRSFLISTFLSPQKYSFHPFLPVCLADTDNNYYCFCWRANQRDNKDVGVTWHRSGIQTQKHTQKVKRMGMAINQAEHVWWRNLKLSSSLVGSISLSLFVACLFA